VIQTADGPRSLTDAFIKQLHQVLYREPEMSILDGSRFIGLSQTLETIAAGHGVHG
jgi:hypothetical protein